MNTTENFLRTVTVVSTSAQTNVVFNSNCMTLAELKRDMNNHNINYDNMSFYIAPAKIELRSDDAQIPTNMQKRDGSTTNDILVVLSTVQKKIANGSIREDLYKKVYELDAQEEILNRYNKNFTHCTNEEILAVVEDLEKEEDDEVVTLNVILPELKEMVETVANFAHKLCENNTIGEECLNHFTNFLDTLMEDVSEKQFNCEGSTFTNDDINHYVNEATL